ncbi:unnamed protein product [marine sediment metagenome]|uniref:Uncharacterized protein n=1 Tax=marine sediment metagenome TaxID=412755 RepID=X0UMQ6_9ZZZZ
MDIKKENRKKEKIPLLLVFKENGIIKTDVSCDVQDYELYGFLKLFVERMGKELENCIEERKDNEEIL